MSTKTIYPSCKTCYNCFEVKSKDGYGRPESIFECRKNAPVLDKDRYARWPHLARIGAFSPASEAFINLWCAEWKEGRSNV